MGQPWRKPADLKWNEQYSRELTTEVQNILKGATCKPTLLLVGPSGHGKTSLLNTLSTVSQGRLSNLANSGVSASHATIVFRRYELPGILDIFRMADTRGIVLIEEGNINFVEKIVGIIDWHIRPGIEFDTKEFPMDGEFYIKTPTESDKVHCVIFVFKISIFAVAITSFKKKYGELDKELYRLDVPRIVVLTHAETIDPKVDEDIRRMFHSEKVKQAVYNASELLGIPLENIHPVVNYTNYQRQDLHLHIPILLALKAALYFAKVTLHKRNQ